tara:strand:+ start:143 stop:481 length:339 start_codon:yes stop_codon:yes gene_type:complete
MHLIKYTLTAEGTQPDYVVGDVLSGGQLATPNDNLSPQDWTLVGVGDVDENNLPGNVEIIPTKQAFSDYVNSIWDHTLDDQANIDNNLGLAGDRISSCVDSLWDKFNGFNPD